MKIESNVGNETLSFTEYPQVLINSLCLECRNEVFIYNMIIYY